MRGHTASLGGGFMTFGGIGCAALIGIASTSDRAFAFYWHRVWFLALFVFFCVVALVGLYIVCAGAIYRVPPKSCTALSEPATPVAKTAKGPHLRGINTFPRLALQAPFWTLKRDGQIFLLELEVALTNQETDQTASLDFQAVLASDEKGDLRMSPNPNEGPFLVLPAHPMRRKLSFAIHPDQLAWFPEAVVKPLRESPTAVVSATNGVRLRVIDRVTDTSDEWPVPVWLA